MDTKYAHTDEVTALSQEQVLERSLLGSLPPGVPPMPLGAIDRVSRSRIRYGVSELVAHNIDNVNKWLQQIAEGDAERKLPANPRAAIELFIELLQFSVPKMKAVQLDVRDKAGNMSRMSISDLQSIVAEQ